MRRYLLEERQLFGNVGKSDLERGGKNGKTSDLERGGKNFGSFNFRTF